MSEARLSEGRGTPARTDLVVLNFGGPATREEVEPFLFELFDDPDVIKLPFGGRTLQRAMARRISSTRAVKVKEQYAKIGGSPIVATTQAQVEALRAALGAGAPKIHVGMRYTAPTIADMVAGLLRDPPDRIVALALYPHWSGTTTGSSMNAFAQAMAAKGRSDLPVRYVGPFHDHPLYLKAMVDLVRRAAEPMKAPHLMFSAHGLPSSYVRDGDPYMAHVQESVRAILDLASWKGPYSLAYQSKVGPVRWLKPSAEEEIHRLAARGVRELLVVPISFVSDHIETLYEIDVTFREEAEKLGMTLVRTAALDTHPDFVSCLADVVRAAIADDTWGGLGAHHCVRCRLPKPHEHRMRVACADCGHATPDYLLHLPPVRR